MPLSKKEREERLDFVRFWAAYIKKTPNKVWSKQQALLINSQLRGARQDPVLYMKIKKLVSAAKA